MGTLSNSIAPTPRKRLHLPRQKKSYRIDFRPEVRAKLERLAPPDLAGRRRPWNGIIEELIMQAPELSSWDLAQQSWKGVDQNDHDHWGSIRKAGELLELSHAAHDRQSAPLSLPGVQAEAGRRGH
jgi:hypothetical protein